MNDNRESRKQIKIRVFSEPPLLLSPDGIFIKSPDAQSPSMVRFCTNYLQQYRLFYGPLIQDNPGELVLKTVGHINPLYCH